MLKTENKKSATCQKKLMASRDCLDVILGKWRIPIIISLMHGAKKFGQINKDISDISPKMLSQELKALEENKIIERQVFDAKPVSIEYRLTAFGNSIQPLLNEILNFGQQFRKLMIRSEK